MVPITTYLSPSITWAAWVAGGDQGAAEGGRGKARGGRGEAGGGGALPEPKVAFRVHETPLWNTLANPADLPDLPDRRSELRVGASLPHAPGVRMMVVKQTPSNKGAR